MRSNQIPWGLPFSEFIGTALLLSAGLSVVVLDFGANSPMVRLLPEPALRRLLTGFLFGTTGALIALSPVGKHSGAHLNPAVTLAFWLLGKMRTRLAVSYVISQLAGSVLGAAPLLAWGRMGASVEFGATTPGAGYAAWAALLGEVAATFALVLGLFLFLRHARLRAFTPLLFPILYAAMVYLEGPISGTSTNPARSFGPALMSGTWQDWWIYWVGPIIGTALAAVIYRRSCLSKMEIGVAKLYHFGHDPHGVFRFSRSRNS